MVPIITVSALSKTYTVPEREAGMVEALKSLFNRKTRDVKAVENISFKIEPGEIVGFLGPNGAGKTTTLKMLSGLLYPSNGQARVLDYEPFQRQRDFLSQITLVMGQRNQLMWDIPAADSYELNRAIYRIPQNEFRQTLDELVDLLELTPLITKPVRNLSLGERMKCEIAGALLHRPKVLFLDEPTIGLDVTAQRRIREFLKVYNARYGAAIMLTSHYMADVEALCKRVIVIHHGHLIFDGQLAELAGRFNTYKTVIIKRDGDAISADTLASYGEITENSASQITLRVPRAEATQVTSRILSELSITDVSITDPPIEDAIERIFATSAELTSADAIPGSVETPVI